LYGLRTDASTSCSFNPPQPAAPPVRASSPSAASKGARRPWRRLRGVVCEFDWDMG